MKYDYWRRVWIIQEFVTSKRFWICFGDNMIPWSMFQAPANDKIHYNGDHPSKASHSLNLFLSLRDERNEGSIPLKDLISLSRDFKCSEPRDRVYGLLGLVPPTDRASLAIDYTKPFLQIFIEAFFRDHWRASSRMFFGSLSTLCCNRDSIQELRRLYLEESLTIPDFQLEVPIHGFIKDLRLHALVCHSGRVIKFRAPSQCSDCTANHSFVYECYIEPSGDSSSRAFSWYYESILYATTKLKIGDALLSVVDPAKAQVVLRSVETGNLACVGMCADVVYSRGSSPQHMEHAGKAPFTQSSSPSSRPKSPSKARAWIKATVRRVSNSPVESSHREEARKVPVIHAQIKPYKDLPSLDSPPLQSGHAFPPYTDADRPSTGRSGSAVEWIYSTRIYDPRIWSCLRLGGERYKLVDIGAAKTTLHAMSRLRVPGNGYQGGNNIIVLSLNTAAILNFLQEYQGLYAGYNRKSGSPKTIQDWLQETSLAVQK